MPFLIWAQTETTVTGKIQDKRTKEPLPYVSIGFKGSGGGTTSDFEGRFKLTINKAADSLIASYIGYKRFAVKIKPLQNQTILIELEELTTEMNEVVIRPGINPALRIIDEARARRNVNNQDNLEAYQYNSYTKVGVSLTNISEELKNRKLFKPLNTLFDTLHQMKNEEGKHILPVFVSETFSKFYYSKNPGKSKEIIEGSKYSGIGVKDDSYITDLLGGELNRFNMYDNFITILGKDFVSPVSDVAHFYYVYTLLDSVEIEGSRCYKIQVNLKRKQDLGFEGTIWVADTSYALKRVSLEVGKNSNLNFLNRIKIQQEFMPTKDVAWMVTKSRAIFDFDRVKKNASGVIAEFYGSYTQVETGKLRPKDFYDLHFQTLEGAGNKDSTYWKQKRTEALSSIDQEMFNKVDSVNNLPVVKSYISIISTLIEGYKRIGPLDWGPYLSFVSFNHVEGLRLRLGFKTNYDFNKKIVVRSYLAYGLRDKKFKYSFGVDYIFNSQRWTVATARYRNDYDILGVTNSPISASVSNIFQVLNFVGRRIRINQTEEYNFSFTRTFTSYWSVKLLFDNSKFTPLGRFFFAWKINPEDPNGNSPVSNTYTYTQAGIEARWAYKEVMISRGHDRIRLERAKIPILIFGYRHGIKGLFNSDFTYDKLSLIIMHHMNTSVFGTADWWIYSGKIFGTLPYPLLDVARGNESHIYSDFNYSLMNFYEFVSDAYIHGSYTQHFEGLFFNKIPFIKTLNLRNAFIVKAAYGSLSNANKNIIPSFDENGKKVLTANGFTMGKPYIEIEATVENIFKFLTFGVVHRLNYLNVPHRAWGYNIGLRIQF
ncbi:MAG: carboxypeptidase-like regulatory domain-containing protein [Bacteroidia bacterium]|nr:carboxypeptidase-like regulatory domain-containing protein [Bacteroidia bacterium]